MRLIDADALKEEVNKKKVVGRFNTIVLIDTAPTVDIGDSKYLEENIIRSKFCPNCGAEMRKGE